MNAWPVPELLHSSFAATYSGIFAQEVSNQVAIGEP